MNKNSKHITMILILSLVYNVQSLSKTFSLFENKDQMRRRHEEESTQRTNAEIEDLLVNAEIPVPHFEDPAIWTVLIRQYGIKFIYTCFSIKLWLVQKYKNIKEVIYENSSDESA